ncbi:hypothetical protein BKA70DRAFT_1216660 [Coprinopsis sp. MPI-PUGE-AT-0042]|nr:hypothetical protein BKA70DRAFT_1216660 [Coprinopsis sp. MPI-PUGE-AT-0042]
MATLRQSSRLHQSAPASPQFQLRLVQTSSPASLSMPIGLSISVMGNGRGGPSKQARNTQEPYVGVRIEEANALALASATLWQLILAASVGGLLVLWLIAPASTLSPWQSDVSCNWKETPPPRPDDFNVLETNHSSLCTFPTTFMVELEDPTRRPHMWFVFTLVVGQHIRSLTQGSAAPISMAQAFTLVVGQHIRSLTQGSAAPILMAQAFTLVVGQHIRFSTANVIDGLLRPSPLSSDSIYGSSRKVQQRLFRWPRPSTLLSDSICAHSRFSSANVIDGLLRPSPLLSDSICRSFFSVREVGYQANSVVTRLYVLNQSAHSHWRPGISIGQPSSFVNIQTEPTSEISEEEKTGKNETSEGDRFCERVHRGTTGSPSPHLTIYPSSNNAQKDISLLKSGDNAELIDEENFMGLTKRKKSCQLLAIAFRALFTSYTEKLTKTENNVTHRQTAVKGSTCAIAMRRKRQRYGLDNTELYAKVIQISAAAKIEQVAKSVGLALFMPLAPHHSHASVIIADQALQTLPFWSLLRVQLIGIGANVLIRLSAFQNTALCEEGQTPDRGWIYNRDSTNEAFDNHLKATSVEEEMCARGPPKTRKRNVRSMEKFARNSIFSERNVPLSIRRDLLGNK